jgi:hypothetical protein
MSISSDKISFDNLNNIYSIKDKQILKYDTKGNLLYNFSNNSLGNITSTDATNPFKILVFYKDFNTLLFLDNTLSTKWNSIDLSSKNILFPTLVCNSHDNGFWVYDSYNTALIRFDNNNSINQKTEYLQNLLNIPFDPIQMFEEGDLLYLNNPSAGIMIFDLYGTYIKTIPLKNIIIHQIVKDNIILSEGNKIKIFNMKTFNDKIINIPLNISELISLKIVESQIIVATRSSINIYNIDNNCL